MSVKVSNLRFKVSVWFWNLSGVEECIGLRSGLGLALDLGLGLCFGSATFYLLPITFHLLPTTFYLLPHIANVKNCEKMQCQNKKISSAYAEWRCSAGQRYAAGPLECLEFPRPLGGTSLRRAAPFFRQKQVFFYVRRGSKLAVSERI